MEDSTKKAMLQSQQQLKLPLTQADRVAIYLELIDGYQTIKKTTEASKLMQRAMTELAGTREEEMLMLCNADLALTRGDVDGALTMLKVCASRTPPYILVGR